MILSYPLLLKVMLEGWVDQAYLDVTVCYFLRLEILESLC